MKIFRRIAGAALAALLLLVLVLAYRTLTFEPPAAVDHAQVLLAPAPAIDLDRTAAHLGEAIRIPTVSNQDPTRNDIAQWDRLHEWLVATYPHIHAVLTREIVGQKTLLYTWEGSDPSLDPIVLMAHQDVVPVAPQTEGQWTHPPFSGAIADGAVWGRGAIDDKGSLVGIFEAVEALAASGFAPARTVIVIAGHDEETVNSGAIAAAQALKARGITAEFVLDEGLVTVADFPILSGPAALIGVAEKGYGSLRVSVKAAGGHSSMPPPETAVGLLADAVLAVTGNPDPLHFDGVGADMIRTLAPHAALLTRVAVANEWLFRPLLITEIGKTAAGAALLHTTMAPTMLAASPKENVLPQQASAVINYRIIPGQTAGDAMQRAREAVQNDEIGLAWTAEPREPTGISSTNSDAWKVIAALASEEGRIPVAPGLVLAATDSRNLSDVAKDIYRYQPLVLTLRDLEMIHGANEHMTVANLQRMVTFYARLIATMASR